MEWREAGIIPVECENCEAGDCYNCDVAGKRWVLSKEDELRTRRALLIRGIARLQRKVELIDRELEQIGKK